MKSRNIKKSKKKQIMPNVLVFSGYGLNCEEETKFAFELAGGRAEIVHINDIIEKSSLFRKYQIIAFPGGFSYGDDTGSGNAFANRIRNHLWENIKQFITGDRLVIGICNGFQILTSLGLLPALGKKYGEKQVALLHNDSARYMVRWVDLKASGSCCWFLNIGSFSLPIAHGEGKFFADNKTVEKLQEKNMIVLKYTKGEICNYQNLPANPTGTLDDIAGITDETGRILGMMPHPERAIFFTQLPHWTFLKEKYIREGNKIPKFGPGLKIFQNAVEYFSK